MFLFFAGENFLEKVLSRTLFQKLLWLFFRWRKYSLSCYTKLGRHNFKSHKKKKT